MNRTKDIDYEKYNLIYAKMTPKKIEKLFYDYMDTLIENTFGFNAEITVTLVADNVYIHLDGDVEKRSFLMGKEGRNLEAMRGVSRLFARRNHMYININLKTDGLAKNYTNQSEE